MIKIIENDLKITSKEIKTILKEMGKKGDASDIFCYPVRTPKKRKKMIQHSTFITAREIKHSYLKKLMKIRYNACWRCEGTGIIKYYPDTRSFNCNCDLSEKHTCPTCKGTGNDNESKLIGLIRIIGDSTYEYYISEVMVIPSMQGKGIGTRLMKKAISYCKKNGFMQIFLSAAKGREKFYKKFGFKPCKVQVMKIKHPKLQEKRNGKTKRSKKKKA